MHPRHTLVVPLDAAYEYAVLLMKGDCALDDQSLDERVLYYLGTTPSEADDGNVQGRSKLLVRRARQEIRQRDLGGAVPYEAPAAYLC